jgi:RHS repeat-associated protein
LRGRKVRVEDPDKGVATIAYDDKDRLTAVTDARGTTLAYTYDALDRRTGVFEGSPSGRRLTEWTFDSLPGGVGEPVAAIRYVEGQAYRTETIGYDGQGRPTGTAVTIPVREGRLTGRYESTVEYNQAGQVERTTLPAAGGLPAETVTTGYNAVGLDNTLGSDLTSYVGETGHTNIGQPSYRILGDRVLRGYAYDESTSRLTGSSTTLETGEVAVDLTFGYDPAGNVVSSTEAASGDTQCFRNDALQRLVEAWTPTNGCASGPSLAALGGPAPYWHSYGSDTVGNRTREVRRATSGDVVRDFAYPAAGGVGPHRLRSVTSGSNVDSYGYDPAGNMVTRPGQALSWNSENRLSKVDKGGELTTFEYDADGERLIRRDPTGSTLYLGDTELRLNTATDTLTATRYYTAGGTTVAVRTESGLSWLVDDHAGTAIGAVDADDLSVSRRRHLPYGDSRGGMPADWPGEQGFVGGTVDGSTGLTHLGARDYDQGIGAFVQVDPLLDVADPQQLHGYTYAENSPVTYSDPTGLAAELAVASRPAVYKWDGAVTAFRLLRYTPPSRVYTVDFPESGPETTVVPGIWRTAMTGDELARTWAGWSPKVPPGYTQPPDTSARTAPSVPIVPSRTDVPEPGDGSWRVDCQTNGAVRTCRYTPIRSWEEPAEEEEYGGDDYPYYAWDIEEREYWEYDHCKPWNPCVTKVKHDSASGSKKSAVKTKTASQNKSSTKKKKK